MLQTYDSYFLPGANDFFDEVTGKGWLWGFSCVASLQL
jgi:hypothetical protein